MNNNCVKLITYSVIPKDWYTYHIWVKALNEAEHYIVCRILVNQNLDKDHHRWAL